jgi:hypothetical protein
MTHLTNLAFVVFFVVFSDLKLSLSADQRSDISKNAPGLTSQLGIPTKKAACRHECLRPLFFSGTRLSSFRYLPILSISSFTVSFAVSLA